MACTDGVSGQEGGGGMISETVSKKTGWPALPFNPMLDNLFPDIHKRRSIQNQLYVGQAINPLGGQAACEKYPWFMGEGRNWRQGILVELGRIAWQFGAEAEQNMASALTVEYGAAAKVSIREVAATVRLIRHNIANGQSA